MFHQERPPNASSGPTASSYLSRPGDFPNSDAQQPCRDYGPPPRPYPPQSGPPALASYSTPRALSRMNWRVARDIFTNQRVQVRVEGYGWVIGLTLSCLKFFEMISGFGCQVRYTSPDSGQLVDGIFPGADIQPL